MPNKPVSQAEYVENERCPVCKSDVGIEGNTIEINDSQCTQECFCVVCESSWKDVYTLVGYTDLEDRHGFSLEAPKK